MDKTIYIVVTFHWIVRQGVVRGFLDKKEAEKFAEELKKEYKDSSVFVRVEEIKYE